jgi:exosome complex component RRP46
VSCGCFAFSFATEISDGPQQLPSSPAARLVWTNWHTKGGVFDEGEFARAQAVGLSGAENVWRAIKESVPQMDVSSALPPLFQPPAEALENVAQSDDDEDIKMIDQESDDEN